MLKGSDRFASSLRARARVRELEEYRRTSNGERATITRREVETHGESSADGVETDMDLMDEVRRYRHPERTPVIDRVRPRVKLFVGLDRDVVGLVLGDDLHAVRTEVCSLNA